MSIPKWKRRPSGLEYVDNAFELQREIMNLASKLSARWSRIYQQSLGKIFGRNMSIPKWKRRFSRKNDVGRCS